MISFLKISVITGRITNRKEKKAHPNGISDQALWLVSNVHCQGAQDERRNLLATVLQDRAGR